MDHHTTIRSINETADRTILITLEKPVDFAFRAGQSVDLILPELVGDNHGNSRTFTIASAPHEDELMIATRDTQSAFKKALAALPSGAPVTLDGPYGSFTLHQKSERPAVFLAGGIGITPFRSMVLDALERSLPHRIYLFYSNRQPKDAAFLDELQALAAEHESFTFIPTMTGTSPDDDWQGERARIASELIDQHASREDEPVYYIAGPSRMVTAVRDGLAAAGISEDDIKYEEFPGY